MYLYSREIYLASISQCSQGAEHRSETAVSIQRPGVCDHKSVGMVRSRLTAWAIPFSRVEPIRNGNELVWCKISMQISQKLRVPVGNAYHLRRRSKDSLLKLCFDKS
jgi:hypothetical protein